MSAADTSHMARYAQVFASFKDLGEWFERIRNDPATQRVTSGSSPMGELRQ